MQECELPRRESVRTVGALRAILRLATAVVAPRSVVETRDEIERLRRTLVEARKLAGEALDALDRKGVLTGWIAPPVKN